MHLKVSVSWTTKVMVKLKSITAQKIKFSIKDFSSKYDQIRRFLRIWSHLLKKSLTENLFFCAVCFIVIMFTETLYLLSKNFQAPLTLVDYQVKYQEEHFKKMYSCFSVLKPGDYCSVANCRIRNWTFPWRFFGKCLSERFFRFSFFFGQKLGISIRSIFYTLYFHYVSC